MWTLCFHDGLAKLDPGSSSHDVPLVYDKGGSVLDGLSPGRSWIFSHNSSVGRAFPQGAWVAHPKSHLWVG